MTIIDAEELGGAMTEKLAELFEERTRPPVSAAQCARGHGKAAGKGSRLMTLPLALRLATATVALVLATSARAEPTPIAVNATPWAFALSLATTRPKPCRCAVRSGYRATIPASAASRSCRFAGRPHAASDQRSELVAQGQASIHRRKAVGLRRCRHRAADRAGRQAAFGQAHAGRRGAGGADGEGPGWPVAVAFERLCRRVQRYERGRDGLPGKASAIRMPRDVESGPENDELEAVGVLRTGATAGRFVAISVGNFTDDGTAVHGWVFGGKDKPFGFTVKVDGTYRVNRSRGPP